MKINPFMVKTELNVVDIRFVLKMHGSLLNMSSLLNVLRNNLVYKLVSTIY